MRKYITDAEVTRRLKEMCVICDSREQVNTHITGYLDSKKIPRCTRGLEIGDYSAMLEDMTLENDLVIERKASLDELCGNMSADRNRFEREFLRAKANGTKVHLIIENASWSRIFLHDYVSKLSPKSLMATLLSWQVRYDITVTFCNPDESGKIIYGILYYAVREALKNGTAV